MLNLKSSTAELEKSPSILRTMRIQAAVASKLLYPKLWIFFCLIFAPEDLGSCQSFSLYSRCSHVAMQSCSQDTPYAVDNRA